MKKILLLIAAFVFVCMLFSHNNKSIGANESQTDIAKKIIRLHLIANSDSSDDQALKLKVRDGVVQYMKSKMDKADDIDSARSIINSNLTYINDIAKEIIANEGYSYNVSTNLDHCYFPTKAYGDLILPPGDYEALIIKIGEGEGHNWWCVMYPSLCFIDCGCAVLPDESKEKLQDVLTYEEYCSVINDDNDDDSNVTYGFRIIDNIKAIFSD